MRKKSTERIKVQLNKTLRIRPACRKISLQFKYISQITLFTQIYALLMFLQ